MEELLSGTVSRQAVYDILSKYYHHNTEVQHAALKEALNMVPLNKEEKDMVDAIGRQDAIKTVKSVCQEVLDQCKSYFDSEIDEEVYSDILEVNAVLKCNKYICKALKELPPVKDSGK